jgi:hypothetical protein
MCNGCVCLFRLHVAAVGICKIKSQTFPQNFVVCPIVGKDVGLFFFLGWGWGCLRMSL